ncbi:unnamed protein product [Schistosoma guineensis]|uniref:Uncharacterized protein n=2 Tax=Schistosoma TaxID=6181 RepID=A0A183MNX4_9TREM|nr:unnamed protein product [Schistosoma guineensis]VDP25001.1 unnamed protein product [Schistosoma margrebowiei]VDP63469.1 unnamed protein product [Schistosoma mattheei]
MSSDNVVTSVLPDSYSLARRHLQLSRAKLKATSRVSALLAGFAMVAIIELQVAVGESKPPEGLLFAFTILSCLLVVVHIMAVMISTCILPHIDSYMVPQDCYLIEEAPHNRLRTFVEVAWICSTVVGIILFLAVPVCHSRNNCFDASHAHFRHFRYIILSCAHYLQSGTSYGNDT